MLPGIMGMMTGISGNTNFAEYLSTTTDIGGANSFSFTSYGIGAADVTRRVFIAFFWQYSGSPHRSISSVSIAGQSATIHIQGGHSGGSTGFGVGIASAAVPTGTSGTIVVSSADTLSSMRIAGWRTTGMVRTTPFDTAFDQSAGNTDDLSVAIDVPDHGFTIGAHNNSSLANNNVAWTGVTEQFDSAGESAAWSQNMAAETNRTVGITTSPEINAGNQLVVLSWN